MHEQFIRVKGRSLRILTARHSEVAPWLVLWPGLGGAAEEFLRVLREGPEHGWNVAALDPPGHGRSEAWDTWSGDAVLSVWDGVLEAVGVSTDVVLGGHSAGAYDAILWASCRSSCGGLVLLEGGYMDPFAEPIDIKEIHQQNRSYLESRRFSSWDDFFAAEEESALRWDHDAEAMLRAQMIEANGEVYPRIEVKTANQVMDTLAQYHGDSLPIIPCRVLVAVATLPEAMAEVREASVAHLRTRIPQVEVVRIDQAGHDLLIDNPEAVSAALWTFLSRTSDT